MFDPDRTLPGAVGPMVFSSPIFLLVFLPVFLTCYYLAPSRGHYRNGVALVGSVLFFAWGEPLYVFFLVACCVVDYWVARAVRPGSSVSPRGRWWLVVATIAFNICLLLYFKYYGFFLDLISPLTGRPSTSTDLVFLLGISFITFHKISFMVDIHTGRAHMPRNVFDYALYLFLFPQLIAGPIIRFHDIGDQIEERRHTAEGALSGLMVFAVGLAKKVLIADPLGRVADQVFALPLDGIPAAYAWGGVLAYTFQIYFDFSGYSEMAIGLGRMMGFTFPANFNRPYLARSITEFWQRWHMTLSDWMRLYLYIPLGGNRVSLARNMLNLWIVFLISGFWHGANWTFVFWGAYYGFFLSAEKALGGRIPVPRSALLRQTASFLVVVIGWVFFRSATFTQAGALLRAMAGFSGVGPDDVIPWGWVFDDRALFTLGLAALISLPPWHRVPEHRWWLAVAAWGEAGNGAVGAVVSTVSQFALTALLLFCTVTSLVSLGYTPFLYFRF